MKCNNELGNNNRNSAAEVNKDFYCLRISKAHNVLRMEKL